MNTRRQSGATLAFVAAAAIVVVLIGVAFFFFARMLGGGREAQSATDSGDLNVAKQAIISPAITVTPTIAYEFSGLLGPGNSVNLLNYNRLVGKAFLVAANAEAEHSPTAVTHATTEVRMVEGSGGVGESLYRQLASSSTNNFFSSLAKGNSVRMLATPRPQDNQSGIAQVAFLRSNQNAPSNVYINNNSLPPGFNASPYLVNKNNKNYITGYQNNNIGGVVVMAVPVRPGEQPHLVNQQEFATNLSAPLGGSRPTIPPNAFESNAVAREKVTAQNLQTRASAIVGVLSQDYVASIPNGWVLLDTGTGISENVSNSNNDVFTGPLMSSGIDVANQGGGPPALTTNGGCFNQIAQDAPVRNNGRPLPMADLACIEHNAPTSQAAADALANSVAGGGAVHCDTTNDFSNSTCNNAIPAMERAYGGGTNSGGMANNLMAIEAFKAAVIAIRANPGGAGCGRAYAPQQCTGLKYYQHGATYVGVPFGTDGTLQQFLNNTTADGGRTMMSVLAQRMYEMNPNANSSQIQAVLSQTVRGLSKNFLYFDSGSNTFQISTSMPGSFNQPSNVDAFLASNLLPDGSANPNGATLASAGVPVSPLTDSLIDVAGDGGYPHPWDCPASGLGQASTDKVKWIPSSGYMNLLGVMQFSNCASGGGTWCCPC